MDFNALAKIKTAWIAALTAHADAELSIKGEEPRQISMMARRASRSVTLDVNNKAHVDKVANYFFVIGFGPKDTVEVAETEISNEAMLAAWNETSEEDKASLREFYAA